MSTHHPDREAGEDPMGRDGTIGRYEELLADEVLWGLDDAEALELESLATNEDHHAIERVALETTGAALAASLALASPEAPPADVRARMEAMALHFLASEKGLKLSDVAQVRRAKDGRQGPGSLSAAGDRAGRGDALSEERGSSSRAPRARTAEPASRRSLPVGDGPDGEQLDGEGRDGEGLRRKLLWTQLLAAASLLVALGLFVTRGSGDLPSAADAEALYSELAGGQSNNRLVRYEWTMPGGAASPEGEVLWDPVRQRGVMTFRGLAPVADQDALQLWIFDGERDKAHPVDGGVFDPRRDGTRAADGTLYVPIDAKLAVSEAFAFAVTKESDKGVVVSDRKRIVSLAGQIERL